MNRALTLTATIAALALAALAPTPAAANYCSFRDIVAANAKPTAANLAAVESAVICLTNNEREAAGLARLTPSPILAKASKAHSQDMVSRRFFAHAHPSTPTQKSMFRAKLAGYCTMSFCSTGENLYCSGGSTSTPRHAVTAWMNSAGHRANILAPKFREIGVGIVLASPSTNCDGSAPATYTQVFGAQG